MKYCIILALKALFPFRISAFAEISIDRRERPVEAGNEGMHERVRCG